MRNRKYTERNRRRTNEIYKKTILVLMAATLLFGLFGICGCGNSNSNNNSNVNNVTSEDISVLEEERDNLQAEISELESELDKLEAMVIDEKEETGTVKYVITFSIRQKHYNLSLSDAVKDSVNEITIQIPVDKEYYDSVEIGDVIDDSFRVGSLIMSGSFGAWDITVENKEIQ